MHSSKRNTCSFSLTTSSCITYLSRYNVRYLKELTGILPWPNSPDIYYQAGLCLCSQSSSAHTRSLLRHPFWRHVWVSRQRTVTSSAENMVTIRAVENLSFPYFNSQFHIQFSLYSRSLRANMCISLNLRHGQKLTSRVELQSTKFHQIWAWKHR